MAAVSSIEERWFLCRLSWLHVAAHFVCCKGAGCRVFHILIAEKLIKCINVMKVSLLFGNEDFVYTCNIVRFS